MFLWKDLFFWYVTWDPHSLFKTMSGVLMAWFSCSLITALSKHSSENSVHTEQDKVTLEAC